MTPLYRWALVVYVAGLLWPQLGLAQRNLTVAPAHANEQRVALVMGNSNYKEAPLRNPLNDATDIAETLDSLGFSVTLRTNANTKQMRSAIREFAQKLKRGGVGLFYFAGHGIQSRSGKNYLIPVGADLNEEFELEDEAVDANRVLAGMEEAGNRVNIVILDACRNNPFARTWRGAINGLAQMSAPTGSFVGFATAPGSIVADTSGRNGIFTKYLLENLKHGDPDIDRVFTRVTAAVANVTGNKQVPWKSSSLTGDFYFRTPPAGDAQFAAPAPMATPAPDTSANDRTFWESVKDTKSADELTEYLDRFPNGLFAGLAKTRLSALQTTQRPALTPSTGQNQPLLSPCPSSIHVRRWTNCVGEWTAPNGTKYVGEFKDGKRNGQFNVRYTNGEIFDGEFKADNREGQGTLIFPNGNRYVGKFKDGSLNGQGVLTYSNGDQYVGEFKDNKRNGYFTFTFSSGHRYVGEMKDDNRNGQGTETWPNGAKYIGEFKDDKQDGKGSEYRSDGSLLRSGIWENGNFVGSR